MSLNIRDKVNVINEITGCYMTEELMKFFDINGFNLALSSKGKLIGNRMAEGSYFEIDNIQLGDIFDNQSDEVVNKLYDFIVENFQEKSPTIE